MMYRLAILNVGKDIYGEKKMKEIPRKGNRNLKSSRKKWQRYLLYVQNESGRCFIKSNII